MISELFTQFGGWIIGALGLLATFAMTYYNGRQTGKLKAEVKAAEEKREQEVAQIQANADKTTEVVSNANKVANDVSNLSSDDVDQRLRDKWSD